MGFWIMRLFGLVVSLISSGLVYIYWQQLIRDGTYSFRIAALAPIGVVLGLYLVLFPNKAGRPEATLDKFLALLALGIGAAAGAYNWYLMDPDKFGFLGF